MAVGVPLIVAVVPLNFTVLLAAVVLKFVPVIVTDVPTTPLVGVKDETVGAGIKVNPANVPVPPGVVTDTLPDVPAATTAIILVGDTTVNDVAAVPPKLTAVAPLKLVPVIVTTVATEPETGLNEEMLGKKSDKVLDQTPPPLVPAKRFVPLTARESTAVLVRPVFAAVQILPLSLDKKTPPPLVPAKRFVPLTASELTDVFVRPLFTTVQLLPLLVDKKTPPPPLIPAKRFVALTARELTVFVRPVFTAVQLLPLLVDKKTPPP